MKVQFKFGKDSDSWLAGDIKLLPYKTALELAFYGHGSIVKEKVKKSSNDNKLSKI